MNVTERMEPERWQRAEPLPQRLTSLMLPRRHHHLVEDAMWRPVRDEHPHVAGNQRPLGGDLGAPLEVERPIIEPRLSGRSPEVDPRNRHARVPKVRDSRRDKAFDHGGSSFEHPVVISGHQELVLMGERPEPAEKPLEFL